MLLLARNVSYCNHEFWSIIPKIDESSTSKIILTLKSSMTQTFTTFSKVIYCLTVGYQCWKWKTLNHFTRLIAYSTFFLFSFLLSLLDIYTFEGKKIGKWQTYFNGLTRREETVSTLDETNSLEIFSFPHIFHHTIYIHIQYSSYNILTNFPPWERNVAKKSTTNTHKHTNSFKYSKSDWRLESKNGLASESQTFSLWG